MINNKLSNISDLLTLQAINKPNNIAIKTNNRTISYLLLDEIVSKIASLMIEKGVKVKDVVALTFYEELEHLLSIFALARIGAVSLPLPLNTPKIKRNDVLKKANVKFLLIDRLKLIDKNLIYIKINIQKIHSKVQELDKSLYFHDINSLWLIIIGSGTTGKSKLIPIKHSNEIERTRISSKFSNISSTSTVSSFISIFYSDTIRRFLETVYIGASFVLSSERDLLNFETYTKFNITMVRSTVYHIEYLITTQIQEATKILQYLEVLSLGTSTVTEKIRAKIQNLGMKNLVITYGTNETGTITSTDINEVYKLENTVGFAPSGVEISIVNKKNEILSHNEKGFIKIKSLGMISSYLGDKLSTKKAFSDGWFFSGDVGMLTDSGELIHLGRSDNMIITNGINIYPVEIEHAISSHDEIRDVFAFAIKSEINQDIPICVVSLIEGSLINEKKLIKYAHALLGPKTPRRIIILDIIPRNERGKLIKKDVIEKVKLLSKF